jgi:hypothetical protein
LLNHVF